MGGNCVGTGCVCVCVCEHNRQFDAIVCRGVKVLEWRHFWHKLLPDIILIPTLIDFTYMRLM